VARNSQDAGAVALTLHDDPEFVARLKCAHRLRRAASNSRTVEPMDDPQFLAALDKLDPHPTGDAGHHPFVDARAYKEGMATDGLTLELEVIQTVGRALAKLPDPEAQRRVIQWINDRFRPSPIVASADRPDRAISRSAAANPGLAANEGFELARATNSRPQLEVRREAGAEPMHREVTAAPTEGIEELVRGFVADFQRVALEWQGVDPPPSLPALSDNSPAHAAVEYR
jgi:hypothetical protein